MLSRRVAFVLIAAACAVAAGVGAYLATAQYVRPTARSATGAHPPPAPPAEAVQLHSAEPAPSPHGAEPSPVVPPKETAPNPAAADHSVRPSAPVKKPAPRVAPVEEPARPVHADVTADPAQGESSASPAPFVVDPATAAQRSWPGSPTVPPPLPAVSAPTDEPAQETAKTAPDKSWTEITIPADSVVGLRLETPLSSETARIEDRVDARVTRDIRVEGKVAVPAGSHAIGSVVAVERGGRVRDRARLGIRFHTIVLPDAAMLTVTTDTVFREGEAPGHQASAKIGGAAIGGAIIGAILGGGKGAAIGSGIGAASGTAAAMAADRIPVVLAAGTHLNVRMTAPVSVTVEK